MDCWCNGGWFFCLTAPFCSFPCSFLARFFLRSSLDVDSSRTSRGGRFLLAPLVFLWSNEFWVSWIRFGWLCWWLLWQFKLLSVRVCLPCALVSTVLLVLLLPNTVRKVSCPSLSDVMVKLISLNTLLLIFYVSSMSERLITKKYHSHIWPKGLASSLVLRCFIGLALPLQREISAWLSPSKCL